MPVVVQIDAYDPSLPGTVTLRMASDDSDLVCHLNGQTWWPVLDRLPLLAMDFFGGEFGQVTTAAASISLSVEPWPDFARYAFPDARLQLWHGDHGAAWAGYTLRFDGRVTAQPVVEDGRAQIGFAVDDKWLDTPLLSTYAGTGGAEGQTASKGTPKPLAIGSPMGVPGVVLDPIKSIIQLSAYGAIESVDVPLERLARQFGSPLPDYASYAALDAATVPAGQWATCRAAGLVRMGAPPYGKLCFLMKGDKGGVDGWARRPGAIIKRLASIAGGSAKVSEAAVDALDAARPYDISLYYDGQISARQAIQEVAASVNAVAGVSLTGQLITVPVQINGTGLTYYADGSAVPMLSSVRALGIAAPWWRLAIGAQPFWDVHSQGDYVGLLISAAFPSAPPEAMLEGGIYIDGTGKKFRFSGSALQFNGQPLLFNGAPMYTSGYLDAQDQATVQALADAADAQAAALAAASAAVIAQGLAADAQATADGKVQTYYQASAPVAEGLGDLWFDTDDGNKQYRWSGSAWLAVQDAAIGQAITDAAGAQATADGKVTTFISETTPTAEGTGDLWFKASVGELRRWNGTVWGDPLVDLTAAKQVTVVPPVAQIVYRDWQGNIKSGQYPRTLTPKVERGGTDIRTSNDVSYSITTTGTIAATVNNTTGNADKGRITVTAGSSGSVLLTVTVLGVLQPVFTIPFTNQDDNPPTTGGGGGGSGNTGGSDSTLEDVTSTSFAAITQADAGESVFLIDITSGQTINGNAPLTYTKSGTNGTATAMTAKWQYRLQGDPTWLDFAGSSITGTGAFYNSTDFSPESGEITANQSKGGLATGTYECQLVAAKSNSAAGNLQVVSGAATVSRT